MNISPEKFNGGKNLGSAHFSAVVVVAAAAVVSVVVVVVVSVADEPSCFIICNADNALVTTRITTHRTAVAVKNFLGILEQQWRPPSSPYFGLFIIQTLIERLTL